MTTQESRIFWKHFFLRCVGRWRCAICWRTTTVGDRRAMTLPFWKVPFALKLPRTASVTECYVMSRRRTLISCEARVCRYIIILVGFWNILSSSRRHYVINTCFSDWVVSARVCQCRQCRECVSVASVCLKCHDGASGSRMLDQESRTWNAGRRDVEVHGTAICHTFPDVSNHLLHAIFPIIMDIWLAGNRHPNRNSYWY